MKTIINLSIIILFFSASLFGQTTKHVLFLGNSYTAVNNLPSIVASLALSTGDSLIHNQNLPGGYTLQGHSTNTASLALIQQGNWDYVVLQEQSQKPSWPISQVISDVFPYAKSLSNSIRQANQCAMPLFYMTWGRKNGDSYNCASWPPVCTYAGMDSLLNLRYQMMADSNDAYVSPVGEVWHYIRDNYPNIELYSADESHPSMAGSYAAACAFYSLIFQKDPSLISDNYSLDPTVAANIRSAAKIVAFDSLAKWNVGKYIPKSHFSSQQNSDTTYFTNQSIFANSYKWSFGDGTSSSLFEPSHLYTSTGNYNVILEVFKCGLNDTTSKNIQVTISSIEIINQAVTSIYPNPISNKINIQLTNEKSLKNISLYSVDGRLIESFGSYKGQSIQIEIDNLVSGIYLLKFEIEGVIYQYKVVKQ